MAIADDLHKEPVTVIAVEGARIGLLSCPICGACLKRSPQDAKIDPIKLHAEHHEREQEARRTLREPSKPRFRTGQVVRILRGGFTNQQGKIVDYWEEPGPVHWYTIRLNGCHLKDYVQDEIELLVPVG